MTWKKNNGLLSGKKKYVLQANLDTLYHKLLFFFFLFEEKKYLMDLFNLKTIFVKQVCWCATFWDGGEICVCPCCFALLLSHFSIIKKVQKWLMNSASTHIYRLTSIRSVSIRSYKAERLHFIFEKIWKNQGKKKKKQHWLFLPPESLAGCDPPVLSMSLDALPALSSWGWIRKP